MSIIHKRFFMSLIYLLGSGMIFGLFLLPVTAQDTGESGKHLVFLPYNDQSDVNLSAFPTVEARFLLVENGIPSQASITGDMISLYEDDHKIEPIQYRIEPRSIHLTIIVDAESIYDLGEDIPPSEGVKAPSTQDLVSVIYGMNGNDDHIQLCFTLGLPHCKNSTGRLFNRVYSAMLDDIPKPVGNAQEETASLHDMFELAIMDAENMYQTPVIVLVRTPRVDKQPREMPDIPESILADLAAQEGVLIVLDRTYYQDSDVQLGQSELIDYLEEMGAYYYTVISTVDNDERCDTYNACIQQHMEEHRSKEYVVTYQSRLFQDKNSHELMMELKLDVAKDEEVLVNVTEFDFGLTRVSSDIKPYVRYINSLLVICAPLFLILILVASADVYQEKNIKS